MAGISFDSSTGIITVQGSDNADFVHVLTESASKIKIAFAGVDTQTFTTADVSKVKFLGEAGDDWFKNFTAVSTLAYGHSGNDFFEGGSGEDRFFGGPDDDRLLGNAGNDVLIGESGNDHLDGGPGNDQIFGNEGNDRLFGGLGEDVIAGQIGDDIVFGDAGHDQLYGNAGEDQLIGGEGADRIIGGTGNDILFGQGGTDILLGEEGDDWISGGELSDSLLGGTGKDRLFGNGGDDQLFGGDQDDFLSGNEGNDLIQGEAGDDRILGGDGVDLLFGNAGIDHIDGGPGNDTLLGNEGADSLFGNEGRDRIFGHLGDDVLVGGADDDQLFGNDGLDIVFGGTGDDLILGNSGNDYLAGQEDNDEILGGAGNDVLRGGTGNDRLFGQIGEDALYGDEDSDIVDGGANRDFLRGGAGDDDIYQTAEDDAERDSEDDEDAHNSPFARPAGLSNRLTVSFAADGTSIFDQSSEMFSAFATMLNSDQIIDTILTGFNTWAQHGNLDIGLVADSGDPFGTPGRSFGDPRFGDVRIGAIPMPSDVYAVALGQGDFVSGTFAGDILFNSNAKFRDAEHFFSVALHEVGHALGLKHTRDVNSTMHRFSTRTELSGADILTFQDLYGLRNLDSHDEDDSNNNDSMDQATQIEFSDENQEEGGTPSIIFGDISQANDVDYFKVDVPDDYSGTVTFRVVSEGISQLAPSVSLYSKDGDLVEQVDSGKKHGDLITISAPAADSLGRFFLKVTGLTAAARGSFSVATTLDDRNTIDSEMIMQVAKGQEFLQLDQEDIAEYFVAPDDYLLNEDGHGDDDPGSAMTLDTEDGYEMSSRYVHKASLLDDQDIDTYEIKSLKFDSSENYAMNVAVRAVDVGGMIPKARLLDQDGNEVPSQITVNGHGEFIIQADAIESDQEYFISITSDRLLPFKSGNYELTISYSPEPVVFDAWASGSLDSGVKKYHSLHVAESQVIQFAFEADPLPGQPNVMAWATIYDENGVIVYQNATRGGERRTANTVFFKPGSYTVEIENGVGSSFAGLDYRLVGIDVGESQGPKFSDPSDSPFDQNPAGDYIYPDGVVTDANFVLVDGVSSNQDPPPADQPPVNIFNWYWGLVF